METFDSSQKGVSSLSRTTTSKADPDTYNMGGDNAEITLFVTLRLHTRASLVFLLSMQVLSRLSGTCHIGFFLWM